jgi:hypothetical protein
MATLSIAAPVGPTLLFLTLFWEVTEIASETEGGLSSLPVLRRALFSFSELRPGFFFLELRIAQVGQPMEFDGTWVHLSWFILVSILHTVA